MFASQFDHVERRVDSGFDFRPRDSPHFEPERDVAEHSQVGKQGIGLKDEIDGPEIRRHIPHGASLDQDLAPIRTLEPGQQSQGGGLAGPAGTKDGKELSPADLQRQMVHGEGRAVALDHVSYFDAVAGHCSLTVNRESRE